MAEQQYAGSPTPPPAGNRRSLSARHEAPVVPVAIDRIPSGCLLLIDGDWRIVQMSESRAHVTDVERGPLIGKRLWDAYPLDPASTFSRECHRAMEQRVEVRFEQPGAVPGSISQVIALPMGDGIAILTSDVTENKRIEADLHSVERDIETMMRHAPAAIFTISFRPPRFIRVNQTMCDIAGYSAEELLAIDPVQVLAERSKEHFAQRVQAAAAGEPLASYVEYYIRRKDGAEVLVAMHMQHTRGSDGRVDGACVMGHDITERRNTAEAMQEARKRLEILSETTQELLSKSDAEAAIQGIAERLMDYLECDIFLNYVMEDDGTTLRLNACSGLSESAQMHLRHLEVGHAICGCVAGGAGRIVSEDVQHNGDPRADLVRSLGMHVYLCEPLVISGRTAGTISFGSRKRTSFSDEEMDFIRAVAGQLSVAVERSRTERALQRSEQRLRTVLEGVADGIAVFDVKSGAATFISHSKADQTGFSTAELASMGMAGLRERVHPEDQAALDAHEQALVDGAHDHGSIEYRWLVRSGEYRWFSDRLSYVRDERGELSSVILVSRDVTEAKRRDQHARLLVAMTDDFAAMSSADDILRAAGERLGAYLGLGGVHFADIEEHADRITVQTVWGQAERGSPVSLSLSNFITPDFYVQTRAGRTIVVNDATRDPRTTSEASVDGSVLSFVSVPFTHDGTWQWLFTMSDDKPREWRPDEIELIEDVAGRLFPRIERARGDDALKQSEARWNYVLDLSEALRRQDCAEDIEEVACRMLLDRLDGSRCFYAVPIGDPEQLVARRDFARPGVTSIAGTAVLSSNAAFRSALAQGIPVFIDDVESSELLDAAQRESYLELGVRSLIDYPLMRKDRMVAVLGVHDSRARLWNEFELSLLRETADRAWAAIERTNALDRLRESLQRTTVLKELASAVASSLDPRQLAEAVLATARDLLGATSGNVYLLTAPEGPARVVAHFGYPADLPHLDEVIIDETTITGRAVMDATVQITTSEALDAERQALDGFGAPCHQLVCIPLVLRSKVIGTLGLCFSDKRHFDENDADLFEALGDQLVVGFENARLFETEHNIAETLQETLVVLPTRLRGVAFSRSYESATFERGRVGGDFVDIFEVHGHQIGVVMGDVSGKGVDAAVTTSLVRNTLRAHAVDGLPPAELCAKANKVMCRYMEPDDYVTLFFGLLSTRTGELRYVSAGHPPGLVMDRDDTIHELEANSPILGAFDYAPFRESRTILRRGQKLVLYSDGVTEARAPEGGAFYNLSGLKESLVRHRTAPIPGLATRLMDDVIRFSAGVLRDDAALLIVQPTKLRMRAADR